MIRIGVDFGGTKIEAVALDEAGAERARLRTPNPGHYEAALITVTELVEHARKQAGALPDPVGVGIPGSVSPSTGLIRGANSTWLNGRDFASDLTQAIGRPVRLANDANCLALSEAMDGAAAGAEGVVFAAILGTGVGGGIVVNGELVEGANGVAGEWGHTPLPWPSKTDTAPACWCGRQGCLETYLSGPGLANDHARATGQRLSAQAVVAAAGGRWPRWIVTSSVWDAPWR
jgi:fructokinase